MSAAGNPTLDLRSLSLPPDGLRVHGLRVHGLRVHGLRLHGNSGKWHGTLRKITVARDVATRRLDTFLNFRKSSRGTGYLGWRADPQSQPTRRSCQAIADWSVSDATWSTMARLRAASVVAWSQSAANPGSRFWAPLASSISPSSVSTSRCCV